MIVHLYFYCMNRIKNGRVINHYILIAFIFILTSILYSCGNKKATEKTAADSVLSSVETAVAMDSVALSQHILIPEDTIKHIKVVYVADKEGATAYAQMEKDSAMEIALLCGQQLEVLEEYPNWYKVLLRRKFKVYIFHVIKQAISTENPIGVTLFYPAFQMILGGFIHEIPYESESSLPRYYQQNGEENSKAKIIQKDSIFLYEGMDSYDVVKQIRFVPKNKTDRFIVSLAYGQHIYEVTNYTKPKDQWKSTNNLLHWEELTPYQILPDTGGVFMPIFYYNLREGEEVLYRTMMAKKHHLKDTSMVIPREYPVDVYYVYKNRYFSYSLGSFYLRIQRLVDGKVKETRYIVIEQNETGC